MENSVDPDQLASEKPADLDQHCFKIRINRFKKIMFVFVCFVALRPKSTAMVMARQSVHLTTLFPGQA